MEGSERWRLRKSCRTFQQRAEQVAKGLACSRNCEVAHAEAGKDVRNHFMQGVASQGNLCGFYFVGR
jgi:hypothetical protein